MARDEIWLMMWEYPQHKSRLKKFLLIEQLSDDFELMVSSYVWYYTVWHCNLKPTDMARKIWQTLFRKKRRWFAPLFWKIKSEFPRWATSCQQHTLFVSNKTRNKSNRKCYNLVLLDLRFVSAMKKEESEREI